MSIFVFVNCTSELQPTNVILQKPLKHALKVISTHGIFEQLKTRLMMVKNQWQISKMGFKVNLKPKIFGWLHEAWIK
jgi:hypothetical protein